jgi:hypothetical protein
VSDDWADVLGALAESGARFLVVGAHAMAVHGVPRGTQDLDVWIDPGPANAERVWRGLAAFGAPLADLGIGREDLSRRGTLIRNKRSSGRRKDLADLEALGELPPSSES